MKKTKKLLALLLAGVTVMSIVGCGVGDSERTYNDDTHLTTGKEQNNNNEINNDEDPHKDLLQDEGTKYPEVEEFSYPDSVGLDFQLNDEGTAYTVVGIGTCTDSEIGIPSTYQGLPVTKIGGLAFMYGNFTAVSIPDSVTEIELGAFRENKNLERVRLSKSITSIAQNAFTNTGIKEIAIPDGVTSIGAEAFICPNLSIIIIPSSVTEIGARVFGSRNGVLTQVYFKGTKSQWESISKYLWAQHSNNIKKIICSDGTIDL